MSFLMPDMVACAVIEERLDYLRQHPDHINWLLLPFTRFAHLNWMVGNQHVKQCVDYVVGTKPLVRPYYEMDIAKMPSIVTASSQGEATKFIGDYGFEACAQQIPPECVVTADALGYNGNVVIFPLGAKVGERIWPNLWGVTNGFTSRIVSVIDDVEAQITKVELKDEIPAGSVMKNWRFQTSVREKNYSVNSSIDDVTLTVTLTTAGDHGIHRLMTTVVRYCLKSGRLLFDAYGMQCASIVQQPIVLVDEEQMIWQTGFILECKVTDHWIDHEYVTDDSGPLNVTVTAEREKPNDPSVSADVEVFGSDDPETN
jgi:hypothetical protein